VLAEEINNLLGTGFGEEIGQLIIKNSKARLKVSRGKI